MPKHPDGTERAFAAALAVAPGHVDDDADVWRTNVAKRFAVFSAGCAAESKTADADQHNRLREIVSVIERHIPSGIEKYERILGLREPHPEFRAEVAQAIVRCLRLQLKPPPKRRKLREELIRVSEAAASVNRALQSLCCALDSLTPQPKKWLDKRGAPLNAELAMLSAQGVRFDELSAVADRLAKRVKYIDRGGAPKMLAFNALVTGLASAFKTATGREAKVTCADDEYCGPFVEFVEAVLPLSRGLTRHLGASLQYPSSRLNRGRYIYEHTRKGRKRSMLYGM
jgi:hypothetical protein